MKAIIKFEVYPPADCTKKIFQEWVEFQLGKRDDIANEPIGHYELKLIDVFADKEIIDSAEIEIVEDDLPSFSMKVFVDINRRGGEYLVYFVDLGTESCTRHIFENLKLINEWIVETYKARYNTLILDNGISGKQLRDSLMSTGIMTQIISSNPLSNEAKKAESIIRKFEQERIKRG